MLFYALTNNKQYIFTIKYNFALLVHVNAGPLNNITDTTFNFNF